MLTKICFAFSNTWDLPLGALLWFINRNHTLLCTLRGLYIQNIYNRNVSWVCLATVTLGTTTDVKKYS